MSRRPEHDHEYSAHGGLARYFVEHREVGWMALFGVLVWGALSFFQLPQQEDPTLPRRIARVVAVLPGATASQVEELVTRRLEAKISEQETIEEMSSETRAGVVIISLGQRPAGEAAVQQEWDKLRAKLAEVALPEGALPVQLQTEFGDVVTLLLAVTSAAATDYGALRRAAEQLEDDLRQIGSVGRTRLLGAIGETVQVVCSPEKLNTHGLSLFRLAEQLRQRNQLTPAGSLTTGTESLAVQLHGELRSVEDVRQIVVGATTEGQPLRLGDVAEVRRGEETPRPFHVDVLHRESAGGALQRQRSVMLAVEMKSGRVISEFAREVDDVIARLAPRLPAGVSVQTISDQPRSVEHRIRHFSQCFAEAVLVVIVVALLLMEWRAALIVAFAIPLTVAMTLGGMHLAGIPLHQISIAALIIALGMLVDDPVVAADGINREMAAGRARGVAAWVGPWKLRRPILFATLINIFAFLPLVLLPGDKKHFIYALPVVVTLALVASRIVSMTFVPLLGYYLLRGQRGFDEGGPARRFPWSLVDRPLGAGLPIYRALLEGALRRPWLAVLLAYGLLAASLLLAPRLGRQFFPPAERSQLLIDLALPGSPSLEQTSQVCAAVTRLLQRHEQIVGGAIFVGGSAPRFYYNVTPQAPDDRLAQVLLNTRDANEVPALVARLRAEFDRELTGARAVVKQLEQGPPVDTPIQIRLTGEDLDTLRGFGDRVAAALREASGYQVHDDLGQPVSTLEIRVDQDRASAAGALMPAVGATVRAALAGWPVTELREGGRLVPVVVRLRSEDGVAADRLGELRLESRDGALVALSALAEIKKEPDYGRIAHFGQRRSITVKSYAPSGELPEAVLARARPAIDALALPAGYDLSYEGEARELKQSREEMGAVMLVSLALIALAMVIQFNSVTKSLVVMLTVPLGLIGGLAGLALFHAPLGFMAMLAIVSLAGVIVSHIIVLSDAIEEGRADGIELRAALIRAGLVRMRPVLVTALATAGGLIPLARTGGELWAPLTAVHIFGLLGATVLTLFILPVLYYLFAARLRWFA